ncbi:nostrin-like [Ctenocephalides felis]|uniref:nostrin-like n=1 Tax=Ctenocephalides felis TaxID=7515 RepID=UPI000E6E459F|nr:nostrin-like [Ctenocephalides felis]
MNDVMRKRTLAEMDVDVADGASSDVGCRALVKNEDFFNANREKFEAADAAKAQGQNGYEDLRRYIKSGEDLNKELATILQERAEAEMTYAKQLCKLSSKLNRACRDSRGGVAQALRGVASDMEGRGDVHRQFSNSLSEEIVRPLRQLADAQHRTRKSAELVCDKSLRQLSEWRAAEAKAKKQSHQAARENEKLQDASLDARLARAPSLALMNHSNHAKMHPQPINQNHQNQAANNQNNHQSEKDAARTEQKRKKAELAVKKADVEYYTLCVRAERARLDWESSVTRACRVLEALERERVIRVKGAIGTYCELSEQCAPLMGAQRETQRALARCDPDVELEHVQAIRR